ncbi:MAG: nucleoid occlusion protein [Clostridia bacterium]|nr:nucleoid occlusion protein [Clostridia bacterium]
MLAKISNERNRIILTRTEEKEEGKILNIRTDEIRTNPCQPRKDFDEGAIEELANSIKMHGLIQPIAVRRIGEKLYELIAGERRLRACKSLNMEEIPAIVVDATATDSAILALIENIQRENLGYIEEANAYLSLVSEHGITQEELAERLGKSQSTVANKIRILRLSSQVRQLLAENNLSERHARALLKLNTDKDRLRALDIVIKRGLNVQKTEELIAGMLEEKAEIEKPKNIRIFKDIRIFSNTIRQALDIMKKSGINAESRTREDENYIEYLIKIPKV